MRLALIPLAGTVAALIAILVTRTPREEADEGPGTELPPAPVAPSYTLQVLEDETLQDADTKQVYAGAEEALEAIAPVGGPRPRVSIFAHSSKVTKEDLEEVASKLRARCEVENLGHGAEER